MPKTLHINIFDTATIRAAVKEMEAYRDNVAAAGEKIAKALADMGYQVAYGIMSGHVFTGEMIGNLEVVKAGEGQYILRDQSKAILFFEFGAGARYGGGHPWNDDFGYGPGTYPGNGHWDDPKGWWFPTDEPRLIIRTDKNGQGWGHSYGNKPHMPFYNADKAMREHLLEVAKRVIQEGA